MRRALALLLAPLLLFVAACGEDEGASNPLDEVEVTGEMGEKPELEFEQPFTIEETTRKVLEEGDGEEIVDGATTELDFLIVNGRDGTELDSSYDAEPAEVAISEELLPGIRTGLLGATGGSRVLIGITPEDGFGEEGDPERGLEPEDVLLMVVDVLEVRVPLERAEGEAVEPVEGLPTVELDESGAPTITLPEDRTPPADTVAQDLIKGDGAVVESGQTITVHYTGVLLETGEEFDSSWGSAPVSFPIGTGGVVPGWDEGLVGRTVGSQVLLVIPAEDGYGEAGSGPIPPNAALVFVVDILDAHD